jgi:hypothetical protein
MDGYRESRFLWKTWKVLLIERNEESLGWKAHLSKLLSEPKRDVIRLRSM